MDTILKQRKDIRKLVSYLHDALNEEEGCGIVQECEEELFAALRAYKGLLTDTFHMGKIFRGLWFSYIDEIKALKVSSPSLFSNVGKDD